MKGHENLELPFTMLLSFNKWLEHYDEMAKSKDPFEAAKAQRILDVQAPYPELRDGFSDVSLLEKHKDVIHVILQDAFSEVLTNNEIKAATAPFDDLVFNSSKRFQKILENAGKDFVPQMRNLPEHQMYIVAATVILNFHYGFSLDFKRPFFYDIPDSNGVMRYYRILYNADFIEIHPTDKAKDLTQEDLDELLENFENIEVWKEKIPPNSFISKGFIISNMFDVTAEHSISEIKSGLIASDNSRSDDSFVDELEDTFRSFFNLPDIKVGFTAYNPEGDQFEKVYGKGIQSFLLHESTTKSCHGSLCEGPYRRLLKENEFFAISDVDKHFKISGGTNPYKSLRDQGFKSAIFAPIADNGKLLGILELASYKVNELNSINANKLVDVMPYIIMSVQRSKAEEENLIDAIIQHECTSVHEAVYWRFREEATRFIKDNLEGAQPSFREIVFKDVYPLYGQIDIKDSSQARNAAIQRDLMIQLSKINDVLAETYKEKKLPIYEELMFRINNHIDAIRDVLHTNSEQAIFDFVKDEIVPVFQHLKTTDESLAKLVLGYEAEIDANTESYYDHRRNYDDTVMQINKELVSVIDHKQEEAQAMFPHYFERYKTDGVEHNLYIGDSIVGDRDFDPLYLNNLRLWQLQTMCEMENTHYHLKPHLPVPLDVASLILVYNTSLSIRFRMDEKRFDVDGTYNARYEIIKKRIDKSFIKGTNERLTQPGKMSIVYSQKSDELEYLRYVKFLKSKGYFDGKIEIVELDGLQGVSGLKAIRANILYTAKDTYTELEKTYTYEDLMEELKP
ncbi:MAG: GAF domain-containing protein [Bacteroidota bacterium]